MAVVVVVVVAIIVVPVLFLPLLLLLLLLFFLCCMLTVLNDNHFQEHILHLVVNPAHTNLTRDRATAALVALAVNAPMPT